MQINYTVEVQMDHRSHDFEANLNGAMDAFGEILATALPVPIDLEHVGAEDASSSAVAVKLVNLLEQQTVPEIVSNVLVNWVDSWFAARILGAQVLGSPDPVVVQASWSSYQMLNAVMLSSLDFLRAWRDGTLPPEALQ